jgi:arsenate reductase (thioredoxin)
MSERVYNVLFLCTANSARSLMAESILNQLGRGRFAAYSAGSHPAPEPNPDALAYLRRNNIATRNLRSKDWTEFAQPGAPKMDFVITVCDKAAGEVCPVWPGQPISAHWGVEDPVPVRGSDELRQRAFSEAYHILNRRISIFLSLPLEKLDRLALQRELSGIGKISA